MIEQLHIRDLGVIANATLELGPGFTAITGETGAGKTMVVSALGLLMGERADAGAVRTGADAARVGGLIRVDQPAVRELVDEIGGQIEDGDLTLTRTVSSEGRSRASVGGGATPVGTLAKLAQHLFVVHGQSEQLRLKSGSAQRQMLDRFGGSQLLALLEQYRQAHAARITLESTLTQLTDQRDERLREAHTLRSELEDIEAIEPKVGEELELKLVVDRLSNLEELRAATSSALAALVNETDEPFASDASGLINLAVREIERVADADPKLHTLAETLRSLSFQTSDLARELASYASDLDQDGPAELAAANDRLSKIIGLLRRFGPDTGAVLEHAAKAAERLLELEGDDERIEQLQSEVSEVTSREHQLAAQLSEMRRAAASKLSSLVTAELQQLALPDAELFVDVTQTPLGKHGADEVTLLLRPHPGSAPRPLSKGASGGELSRVMLALEVVVAATDPVPTFVFDEVDAGIGGAAAIEIGRRLSLLAKRSQVIVVTHLAQVAAFANNHLKVEKDASGEFTQSSCRRLEGKDRLSEMARLLSGLSDSESALAHARELVSLGESQSKAPHVTDTLAS